MSFLKNSLWLNLTLGFFVITFATSFSLASSISVPAQHVYLEVKTRYGIQWTKVFKDGSAWACQTDLLPYFEAKGDPLTGLAWNQIKSLVGKPDPACESQITLIDRRSKISKTIHGCLSNPDLDHWVEAVHHRCGRR